MTLGDGDVLRSAEAGGKVIRGGALRAAGYGVGFVVGAGSAVLLTRHLGVAGFGRYAVVTSLLAIVSGVTDAGLTAVGARELALQPPGEQRRRLLANLVALRLVLTPLGVLLAAAFAVVAGYDSTLVYGTLLGGAGVVLVNAQATLMMPLSVELRMAPVTGVEVLKQVLTLAGIALLVALGASLLPFFVVQIGVGVSVLAITPLLVGPLAAMRPQLDRATALTLLREALPVAIALTMNVIYFRVLIILMSLIATATETGLFGTSFRVFEVLFGVPQLVLAVALPVLAVAGREDEPRLRYALQLMTEVSLVAGTGVALVIAIAAEPAIVAIAGERFRGAAAVLQIQAFALIAVGLGQTWQLGLISIRRQRDMARANAGALVLVIVLGLILIPDSGAKGAAVAAVIAEFTLAATLLALLVRARRSLLPNFAAVPKVLLAAGLAGACVLLPGLSAAVTAVLAGAIYAAVVFATGALPPEVRRAFGSRPGKRPAP